MLSNYHSKISNISSNKTECRIWVNPRARFCCISFLFFSCSLKSRAWGTPPPKFFSPVRCRENEKINVETLRKRLLRRLNLIFLFLFKYKNCLKTQFIPERKIHFSPVWQSLTIALFKNHPGLLPLLSCHTLNPRITPRQLGRDRMKTLRSPLLNSGRDKSIR